MSRSSFKGPFINPQLENKKLKIKSSPIIKTFAKNLTILPEYINKTFSVYNGKKWVLRTITKNMVGYKIGSFIFTRKVFKYKKK